MHAKVSALGSVVDKFAAEVEPVGVAVVGKTGEASLADE